MQLLLSICFICSVGNNHNDNTCYYMLSLLQSIKSHQWINLCVCLPMCACMPVDTRNRHWLTPPLPLPELLTQHLSTEPGVWATVTGQEALRILLSVSPGQLLQADTACHAQLLHGTGDQVLLLGQRDFSTLGHLPRSKTVLMFVTKHGLLFKRN